MVRLLKKKDNQTLHLWNRLEEFSGLSLTYLEKNPDPPVNEITGKIKTLQLIAQIKADLEVQWTLKTNSSSCSCFVLI